MLLLQVSEQVSSIVSDTTISTFRPRRLRKVMRRIREKLPKLLASRDTWGSERKEEMKRKGLRPLRNAQDSE
jgi:hypothetical protein